MRKYTLSELLTAIDPALLSYDEWLSVGMAIHEEGGSCADWDVWSRRDPARYHNSDCEKRWRGFHGSTKPVTAGTLVEYARRQGTLPETEGHELAWDDEIRDDGVIVDANWLEDKAVHEPAEWNPRAQIIRYLELLFDSTDLVGYVTEVWTKDGKPMPTKGAYDRTAGELIGRLNRCGDITDVIGTVNPEVGAWVRFNPLDGHDVTNANVTDYRYALVESDSMPIERQYAMLMELNLPIRVLVHSGGKSLHAIVRIDAGSMEEYRKRVDYMYGVCKKNGFEIDQANRNPSRLSRLPGVTRNGNKQYIVAEDLGAGSFAEWQEWIEAANDDLPDLDSMAGRWDNLPPLAPPLIDGLLRQGHKMLIAGPSKAGKSYALIEMVIAIAEGTRWMGHDCAQGKVLYVNLELDRASCFHRFRDVYEALHIAPNHLGNIDIWNLRGHSIPMDKLAPKLIRRAMKRGYIAVVIDPIYKVLTGDENNADQMAKFCNQFDKVCTELGTAVIYCHHHSKGAQGGKRAMDRASGSGVFARDPDAMLDLIELELTDSVQRHVRDRAAMDAIAGTLDEIEPNWRDEIPLDDQLGRLRLELAAGRLLDRGTGHALKRMQQAVSEAEAKAQSVTAWRIEGTLREFPKPAPINLWFRYPVHEIDESGVLADMNAEEALPAWQKGARRSTAKRKQQNEDKGAQFAQAVESAAMGEPPTVKELSEYMNIPERTVRDYVKRYNYYIDKSNENKVRRRNTENQ